MIWSSVFQHCRAGNKVFKQTCRRVESHHQTLPAIIEKICAAKLATQWSFAVMNGFSDMGVTGFTHDWTAGMLRDYLGQALAAFYIKNNICAWISVLKYRGQKSSLTDRARLFGPYQIITTRRSPSPSKAKPRSALTSLTLEINCLRFFSSAGLGSWLGNEPSTSQLMGKADSQDYQKVLRRRTGN